MGNVVHDRTDIIYLFADGVRSHRRRTSRGCNGSSSDPPLECFLYLDTLPPLVAPDHLRSIQ